MELRNNPRLQPCKKFTNRIPNFEGAILGGVLEILPGKQSWYNKKSMLSLSHLEVLAPSCDPTKQRFIGDANRRFVCWNYLGDVLLVGLRVDAHIALNKKICRTWTLITSSNDIPSLSSVPPWRKLSDWAEARGNLSLKMHELLLRHAPNPGKQDYSTRPDLTRTRTCRYRLYGSIIIKFMIWTIMNRTSLKHHLPCEATLLNLDSATSLTKDPRVAPLIMLHKQLVYQPLK